MWAIHVQAVPEIFENRRGLVHELRILTSPWSIDPAEVTAPVALWVGAEDKAHPPAHSHALAALLGGARVTVVPDAWTFGLVRSFPDVRGARSRPLESGRMAELVLVTGGSGFIGAHCIRRLFADGYRVRTTVRSLEREAEVRATGRRRGARVRSR